MPGRPVLARRQAVGLICFFCLLLGGRVIRHTLLVDPAGNWREELWLDELVLGVPDAQAEARTRRPKLTAPLPINSCSRDSLTLLPGVGAVLAGRIDDRRRSGLVFRNREDLEQIKGIGPALSARLEPHVVFAAAAPADSNSENSPKSR